MPKITDPAARAIIVKALAEWPPEDLARLAALISLGAPAHVLSAPAKVVYDHDDPAGVLGIRADGGTADDREEEAFRASALDMWRRAGRASGYPMAAPHDLGRGKR